jgi:hypothetical protein
VIADADDTYVPSHARVSLETLAAQLRAAEEVGGTGRLARSNLTSAS